MKHLLIILFIFSKTLISQHEIKINAIHKELQETKSDSQIVNLYHQIYLLYSSTNIDSALHYSQKALNLSQKINFTVGEIKSLNNLGSVYFYKSKYKEALNYFIKAANIAAKIEHNEQYKTTAQQQISRSFNNIGNIYQRQKNFEKAEEYFNKSIQIDTKLNDQKSIAHCYNNIGVIKEEQSKYLEALKYYEKSLQIKLNLNDSSGIPSTLINIGVFHLNQQNYKEAEKYFSDALQYCKLTKNIQEEIISLINLGDLKYTIKKHSESLPFYFEAAEKCKEQKNLQFLSYTYQSIAMSYHKLKNFEKAYEHLHYYISVKDSIYNNESLKLMQEMQTKFDTETKEKEIKLLIADKELKETQLKNGKIITYSSIAGIILISVFAIYVFYMLKQKQRINHELDLKNKKIEFAYKIIDEKQTEILDSINYAKRIQYALLASEDFLNKYIPKHFVLFKPKDIVSGDFYWATNTKNENNEELFYLACCDSTDHGVPGAFMSLLSIGFLSEAIKEKNIHQPNLVFDYVRNRLIDSINNEQQKDGFDGILVCYNLSTNKITYAAANNNPVIINSQKEIINLPYDKMPVGKTEQPKPFNLFDVPVNKNEMIYLFTDGYADQFGGEKGKKFKYKQLNELLKNINQEPLKNQKNTLDKTIEEWRGNLEQVDDILVIGLTLNT